MTRLSRLLVGAAALLLAAVYVLPLWHVRLIAPQYPEGLGMHIHLGSLQGATETDLTNINNLNHYIGMKRIETDAIPELAVMPWIVAALVAGGLLVAVLGKRRPLYLWLGAFGLSGVVGLIDFWRWEYDYGHNLDMAEAIIKIPGMSYQPPLIGSKQLLNFTATSWPGSGGVAAGLAFALGLTALVLVIAATRKSRAMQATSGTYARKDNVHLAAAS
jgi:copper chaperone NosL